MTPQEQGRFCGQCEKMVVDFSQMNDQEIVDQIKKASRGLCGRFYEDQLMRNWMPLFLFLKTLFGKEDGQGLLRVSYWLDP
jgi:hypothetical protein